MDNTINEISRLCTSSVISGNFFSKQDLRIDCAFIGNICTTGRVVVGESSLVQGDIVCDTLDVWGEVRGNLYVKDTLSLKASSKVKGDMIFDRFQVEIGAVFTGSCSRVVDAEHEARYNSFILEDPRGKKGSSHQNK